MLERNGDAHSVRIFKRQLLGITVESGERRSSSIFDRRSNLPLQHSLPDREPVEQSVMERSHLALKLKTSEIAYLDDGDPPRQAATVSG